MGSERPRNREELPISNNTHLASPASPRPKHSVGSNRSFSHAMHNALQMTSVTKSPNYGIGPRSFISTQNNFENGHPSYSASQSKIRDQTLALGNLNSVGSDKRESPSSDSVVAGQSNLSLLLQKESRTPSPPELQLLKPQTSLADTVDNQNNKNADDDGNLVSDNDLELIEDYKDESQPLLSYHPGIIHNYGNVGEIVDDEENIPWAEKSWLEWLPCVGDDHYHLPNYDGEEPSRPRVQINAKTVFREVILNPISYIPAVILGLLLNLLDAISYGMITFPISNPIFREFGPDGISMFFVSCIVSQVIYSGGFSIFGGGNGSMMIEVVPFLHIMTEIIIREVEDKDEIIPTTILSFALSSVLTGIVFLLMGAFKLGSVVEFFPRHILVGCIGGVGWFLVATAIEVSGHLDDMFSMFSDLHTLALWGSALGLALLLRFIVVKCPHALVVPFYFMIVPLLFYLTVYVFDLKWDDLRGDGWVFPMPEGDVPWYRYYSYYDFKKTNWGAILQTVPAMFALTFFGVLHVPINVPALGVSLNEDNVNTNRELVAHGLSNMLSGLVGSVQNYLVYTNSVLFIKSGGDSRVAGLMLAAATAIVLFIGPWIVGYIPVMVVGALIFHLGIELMKEALIDTWGIVNYIEYLTIVIIVIAMGVLGFVEGIFLGVVLACIFFVVSSSRKNAIRSTFSGNSIKSIVRRRYRQQKFLKHVGHQIYVIKLHGYMFFGTINGVENAIREVLNYRQWKKNPIRFLIVDFHLVYGMDFNAAEAFTRINRLLSLKSVYLVICGASYDSEVGKALRRNGIWSDVPNRYLQIYENFNEALEWCENMLLHAYYEQKVAPPLNTYQIVGSSPQSTIHETHSPRQHLVQTVGNMTLHEERPARKHVNKITAVLMEVFEEISNKKEDFYEQLGPYFREIKVPSGAILWHQGVVPDCLYLVERGVLKATWRGMESDHARPVESILPGTMAGELGFFTGRHREATLVAEVNCVLWQMTKADYDKLLKKEPKLANQFMRLALNFSAERLSTITYYAFHLI